ncbi:MAG: HD domain-containing protein [Clostridiales bacterium]|nr:HD domain-containing protein [Clostridiales bacterium]
MNGYSRLLLLDPDTAASSSDSELRLMLDYFADQTDSEIQNHLVSELMARYADVSKQLADKNEQLKAYSENLEGLVQEKVREISASQIATIHALVKAAESRDDDTGKHIERTSMFCGLIADKLYQARLYPETVDEEYAGHIAKASPLHDIGKIGIMDAILLKPDRLTPDEFAVMKTHVDIGYETLASAQSAYPGNVFLKIGIEIAKNHHEKWDGSGYMQGLAGGDIPLSARIMALSDVYDALRSRRVYKEPFPHDQAYAIIMEGRGSHFDPVLADLFHEYHADFRQIYDSLSV